MAGFNLAPSLFAADFSNLEEAIRLVESAHCDWLHIDVMDGSFVPNISFGPKIVADVRSLTMLPFDVHLMIDNPERMISDLVQSGADQICFHIEGNVHVHRIIQIIKFLGARAGIAIVPSTPVDALREVFGFLDVVLVMTVNPGLQGQSLIPECANKVRQLNLLRHDNGYRYLISVDGGIDRTNAAIIRNAGADVAVVGRSFFEAQDPLEEARVLKGDAERDPHAGVQ